MQLDSSSLGVRIKGRDSVGEAETRRAKRGKRRENTSSSTCQTPSGRYLISITVNRSHGICARHLLNNEKQEYEIM